MDRDGETAAIARAAGAERQLAAAQRDLDAERQAHAAWKALAELNDKPLVCYRIGRNPGSLLDKLRVARERVAALAAPPQGKSLVRMADEQRGYYTDREGARRCPMCNEEGHLAWDCPSVPEDYAVAPPQDKESTNG